MARLAFVLHREELGIPEERLGRILTFFAVPWESVSLAGLSKTTPQGQQPYVVFGSAETIDAATAMPCAAMFLREAVALYAYATENREVTVAALSTLTGADWMWRSPSHGPVTVEVSNKCPELVGPMSGLSVTTQLTKADGVLALTQTSLGRFEPLVYSDTGFAFGLFSGHGPPTYICASAAMVDIDQPVRGNYYDIKVHFFSAVPLVMFITWAFREVMWRPSELGACLIIDDPLLKEQYGFCDFQHLRDLMQEHGFTTNIAFIPWNWRRTSVKGSAFFKREAGLFSVSIHGCDHVAGEFGASVEFLDAQARLAQTRMRRHYNRTGIDYDPVMVFPQGVFSGDCPAVLKHNGYIAAVNTEISPVGGQNASTTVRDVWNTAILAYGAFPIYTRRYAFHGIENFAFDLLLGKPCFIVAHHGFFADEGAALVELIQSLASLNCTLRWRSPREVIRRAYRLRDDNGGLQVEMYANELLLTNASDLETPVHIHKRENEPLGVVRVESDTSPIDWTCTSESLRFQLQLTPRGQTLVRVVYKDSVPRRHRVSITYALAVAARRIGSELRDAYFTASTP